MHPSSLLTASLAGVRSQSQAPLKKPRPQVYRLLLNVADASLRQGADGATFSVNFPGELGLDPERHYMMAVEFCHVQGLLDPDVWFKVHVAGLLCPNLADTRMPSDVVHVQYGAGYSTTLGRDSLGILLTDRTFLRSKTLRLYFTDAAGAPLDLAPFVLGLVVWEV